MKRTLLLIAAVCIALLAPQAHADDLLTTLTSSGSSVSYTLDAAHTLGSRIENLWVQCDAPAYLKTGTSSVVVTATNGQYVSGLAPPYDFWLSGGETSVAIISVSGTVNCKIWFARPQFPVTR